MQAEIGIIGGTGVYNPQLFEEIKEVKIDTPYGSPSDSILIGKLSGRKVAFIPRHSKTHNIRPTNVNSKANIFALKKLGVKRILAPCAVGSLKKEIRPGDVVLVDQFIDRTTKREQSFYTGPQVCHISVANPMCPELRKTLMVSASKLEKRYHETGTYVCIEGPRFSTKAESNLFRSWNSDVVGMTLVPECVLAREAEICYASIASVTDYDVWKDHPVSTDEIIRTMKKNLDVINTLLVETINRLPKDRKCRCGSALKDALI